MGVRYNAEKKKIGMYYSTPIFSFRCKCHLCSGWFEIQTDPQNTRYIVVSGARKKEEDWDPAENGGFAVIDTDSKIEPVDPLAALEKTTDAQAHATKVQAPRLEQLEDLSAHYNEDPYAHSRRVRKRFRSEKKVDQARVEADKSLKEKYGLPTDLALERADDPGTTAEARDEWARGLAARAGENTSKKRKLALEAPVFAPSRRGASTSTESAASSLRTRLLSNSARRTTAAGAGAIDAPIPPTSRKVTSGGLAAGIALRKS
jgi:coiled-coil domain-containing protein 130